MATILHTADLHLKKTTDERWQALQELLKTAKKHKVDVLTISGDLFNQDFDAHQVRDELRAVFSKLDYQIFLLPGNHDSRSYRQGLYFGENVTLLNDWQQQHNINDLTITGIPFESLGETQLIKRLEAINDQLDEDQINVLLFHGELSDIFFNQQDFGDEGDKRYLPLKLNLLQNTKFDYILAGHFHTNFVTQQLPNQRLKQGGFFIYPGSPVSITTKETGRRSAALIKTGQAPEQIELDTYHYQAVPIILNPADDKQVLSNLEKKLKALDKNAAALLSVQGYFDSKKLGLTETQLRKKLTDLTKQYNCRLKDKNYQAKNISSVLDSGLYQTFLKQVEADGVANKEKEQLQQTLIEAMTRVNL